MPSDNPVTVELTSPVNLKFRKSPGNINLCILSYISGSLFFTHASFDAVKFPGEFNKLEQHFSSPISLNALFPISTALPSHHIIELRKQFPSSSTITSPCI